MAYYVTCLTLGNDQPVAHVRCQDEAAAMYGLLREGDGRPILNRSEHLPHDAKCVVCGEYIEDVVEV